MVLVAMFAFITAFVVGYVFVAHSFNRAVTTIDEAVGSLEGYTVLLFDGTQSKAVLSDDDDRWEGVMGSSLRAEELAQVLDAQEAPAAVEVEQAGENEDGPTQFAGLEEDDLSGVFRENAQDKAAGLSPIRSLEKSYRAKDAATVRLDLKKAYNYRDGLILKVGDRRIGVMSAAKGKSTTRSLKRLVRYFHKHDVRCIVCVSDSKKILKGVTGITVAILTYPAATPATTVSGRTGTYYVHPPVRGAAGAAIIGPGYVVSTRTQLAADTPKKK